MHYIDELKPNEIKGKRVLVRAGLNVPVEGGRVVNGFRIRRAVPTLKYLLGAGARVIVISHIGRDPEETLLPVAEVLKRHVPLTFVPDVLGAHARSLMRDMREGEALMLENLRRDERERGNDAAFARALADFADIFVQDAFEVLHREHASVVSVPRHVPSYAGLLVKDEVFHLSGALTPPSPSLAIIGGAKFGTKEPLIKKLLALYGHVFIGGALANDIFKARHFEVGRSLVSEKPFDKAMLLNERLLAPEDVVVERPDGQARVKLPHEVTKDEKIVDVGPDSIATLIPHIKQSKCILWNGPMGLYESGFDEWTRALAKSVAKSDAHTIVGGGDTLAAIHDEGIEEEFGFISTGGGAMLQFLMNDGSLPGITALDSTLQ